MECKSVMGRIFDLHLILSVIAMIFGVVSIISGIHSGDFDFSQRNVGASVAAVPPLCLALMFVVARHNSRMLNIMKSTKNPEVFMIISQEQTFMPVCGMVFSWKSFISLAVSSLLTMLLPFVKTQVVLMVTS